MERVSLTFEGRDLGFDLDHDTAKWTPAEASTNDVLQEGDFPLVVTRTEKRYELYSDGTFAEVEL